MWSLIAAVTSNGGIGNEGNLLCSIPEDLHRFKNLTMGGTLVMGRKTLDSLPGGRPLPGRRNAVLTRNKDFQREGVEVFHSVPELRKAVPPMEQVWVIGGASVYEQLMPLCERLYLTEVKTVLPADRFFPQIGEQWRLEEQSPWEQWGEIFYRFCQYQQVKEPHNPWFSR
jgi:dihydrofolate reductase